MREFLNLLQKVWTVIKTDGFGATFTKVSRVLQYQAAKIIMRIVPYNEAGDRIYAKLLFYRCHNRLPSTVCLLNDSLYQLKASEELIDPVRVFVTDKELLKIFVKGVVGERYNVPTLGILREKADIFSYNFPCSCCIKPTHLSAHYIFRLDGEELDLRCMSSWFDINYYRLGRETNYKTLKPKIIVEPILFGDKDRVIDYKIFCFRGIPKLIQVDLDRHIKHKRKFFDPAWTELDFSMTCQRSDQRVLPPSNLSDMLAVAARVSSYFSLIRVDLYSDGENCFVGELTSCPNNACCRFLPPDAEEQASTLIFQ